MTTNLNEVAAKMNAALSELARVSPRSFDEVLVKHGSEFTRDLGKAAQLVTPGRGSILAERLAALESGKGVKIRESVRKSVQAKFRVAEVRATTKGGRVIKSRSGLRFARGKGNRLKLAKTVTRKGDRLNIQALMVKRELNLREQGRGFTSYGARMKPIDSLTPRPGSKVEHEGRYANLVADAALNEGADSRGLLLRYGGLGSVPSELGDSLATPQGQLLVGLAMERRTADMATYISRQYGKLATDVLGKAFPTTSTN